MFMLKNVGKYLFGDNTKESIVEIPQGQLFLVRPHSPKGYSELIFKDAAASIRQSGQEFHYQLVVQRVYEEGEEELLSEGDGEDGGGEATASDRDERSFLLDGALHFRSQIRGSSERVFAWRDLSGDPADLFEFVCDESVASSTVSQFELVSLQCQYERKYRRDCKSASDRDLKEFAFAEDIPSAGPVAAQSPPSPVTTDHHPENKMASKGSTNAAKKAGKSREIVKSGSSSTVAPSATGPPKALEMMVKERAELHMFDFETGTFLLQDPKVNATVSSLGSWHYWLQVAGLEKNWLGQAIITDINPVFNFEYKSFIFNHYTDDNSAYSWLLRFTTEEELERFQEGLMQALWEHVNETKWKLSSAEREKDYVLNAMDALVLEDEFERDAARANESDEEREVEEEEEEEEEEEDDSKQESREEEDYDSDESQDKVLPPDDDGNVNSQLAVGYKHDRSFVVRGPKIGVFKHTGDKRLEFATTISKIETPDGKLFSPKKVMLHGEDASMLLQNAANPNSIFRMDLEYGKVVEEWKVHDNIAATSIAPVSKFAQMTGEQTVLGLSHNAVYLIDPRQSGNKLVDSKLKQYATKNEFTAAATSDKGYIAVASNKGDVRMFDRLGINAKTHIPALGDPIIGLDVSADGRWLLATTKTYLLLIDTLQTEGKYEGQLGFERSFPKDSKPQPRRLALSPNHVAQFQHESRLPISFKPARFNTGTGTTETSIITASGPFIITWSLKRVLAGRKDGYHIKRYADEVKADDFKFGTDKDVIVALPNEVNMVGKASLQRPTRESIATATLATDRGRRTSARRGKLVRTDVVDSPY